MSEQADLYKILGVNESDSEEVIKKAYKKLAIKWHPDKNQNNKKEAEEKFKEISHAYSIIGDKEKRQEYDMMRKGGFRQGNGPSFKDFDFNFSHDNHTFDFYEKMFKNMFNTRFGDFSAFDDDNDFFSGGMFSNMSDFGGGMGTSTKTTTTIINGKKVTKTEKTYTDKSGQRVTEVTETTGDGKTKTTKMIGNSNSNSGVSQNHGSSYQIGGSNQVNSNYGFSSGFDDDFDNDDFFSGGFFKKHTMDSSLGKKNKKK